MEITMLKIGQPVTEADMTSAEQQIGTSIPAEYKAFLRTYNGGAPRPQAFSIRGKDGSVFDEGGISFFLGIRPGEPQDLGWYVDMYRDRIPQKFFPIATDAGGNLICLSVAGDDVGKVYFWDHEEEAYEDEEPGYDNVYLVGDSFDEFLNNLTEPS